MSESKLYSDLKHAHERFTERMGVTMNHRQMVVARLAGAYFGDDPTGLRPLSGDQPFPFVAQNALSWQIILTPQRPRVIARLRPTSEVPAILAAFRAGKCQAFMNAYMENQRMVAALGLFVLDAIVGPYGIFMTGRDRSDAGMGNVSAFGLRVATDDFWYDQQAREWNLNDHEYVGHRFYMSRAQMKEAGYSKQEIALALSRPTGRDANSSRSVTLADDGVWSDGEYRGALIQAHCPQRKRCYVFPQNGEWTPIREWRCGDDDIPWEGMGYYTLLGYGDIPDSLMFTGLLAHSMDIAETANELWVKHTDAEKASADFTGARGANESDMTNFAEAKDSDFKVFTGALTGIERMQRGRGRPECAATALQAGKFFENASSGMSTRLGANSPAETATEFAGLRASAGAVQEWVLARTGTAFSEIVRKLFYWAGKRSPLSKYPIEYGGHSLYFTKEDADESLGKWNVGFDVYSMRPLNAGELMALQRQMLAEYYQGAQLFAQQQIVPDLAAYYRNQLELAGADGTMLEKLFKQVARAVDGSGVAPPSGKNGQTKPYFRTARNGQQDGASEAAAIASMMSADDGGEAA